MLPEIWFPNLWEVLVTYLLTTVNSDRQGLRELSTFASVKCFGQVS